MDSSRLSCVFRLFRFGTPRCLAGNTIFFEVEHLYATVVQRRDCAGGLRGVGIAPKADGVRAVHVELARTGAVQQDHGGLLGGIYYLGLGKGW
jgi:hypothetical protein